MTLNITPVLEERLQRLASESNRTPHELAQEAIDGLLTHRNH